MDAVYPAAASALARGRRLRRPGPRHRHRTTPVTFAEIKEVDEENSEAETSYTEERRRRPDVLEESLGRQFAEFRRRRAKRDLLRERDNESPPPAAAPLARAGSEPTALNRHEPAVMHTQEPAVIHPHKNAVMHPHKPAVIHPHEPAVMHPHEPAPAPHAPC